MKTWTKLFMVVCVCLALFGCGGPNPDVQIYMISRQGSMTDVAKSMQTQLKKELGDKPTVKVAGAPMYDVQLFMVQMAAGDNDIMILSKEDFLQVAEGGGFISLDKEIDPSAYPEGVAAIQEQGPPGSEKKPAKPAKPEEEHLYGIPVKQSGIMKKIGYIGDEMYAGIMARTDKKKDALQVLKLLVK